MKIDIISYTAEQYATLTAEQLQEVRSAQLKKDTLHKKYLNDLDKEKYKLTKNGMLLSTVWIEIQQKLYSDYQKALDNLREGLLFYLHYSSKPSSPEEAVDAPYTVDYALTEVERTRIVKEYYLEAYSDAMERFSAFKEDKIAPKYLGELYASLYDYFLFQSQE